MTMEELFRGTILEEIFATTNGEGEKFPENDLGPIEEGEVIIGEVPVCAQTCYIMLSQIETRLGEMKRAKTPIQDEELQGLLTRREILCKLQWSFVKDILNLGSYSIGIRQGWQVVQLPEKEQCDCLACQLERELQNAQGTKIIEIIMERRESPKQLTNLYLPTKRWNQKWFRRFFNPDFIISVPGRNFTARSPRGDLRFENPCLLASLKLRRSGPAGRHGF